LKILYTRFATSLVACLSYPSKVRKVCRKVQDLLKIFFALPRPPEGLGERCAERVKAYSCPNVSNDVPLC
jgi:hypothetical protein